jgi:hypothetical protein
MQKVTRLEAWAAISIFAAVCVAGIYRLFLGVSVADEAQYVALADFPRHGLLWFFHDATIQTSSAIILSPFITLYTALFGTEGVVVFSRILYFLSALATGLITARFLTNLVRWPVALVLGASVVAYVPFGMAILCYITMGSQYFAIGSMSALTAFMEKKGRLAALGGVFWVLCVFAYPTAMLTFFVFVALLAWRFRGEKRKVFPIAIRFAGGLIVPTVILVGVLLWCGIDNIQRAVQLSTPYNMPFQTHKIWFGIGLIASYMPPWWLVLGILAIWGALIMWRPTFAPFGLFLALTTFLFFGATSENSRGPIMWIFLMMMLPMVLVQQWRSLTKQERTILLCLVAPAIVGSIVAWMTSRMTIYNMHGTGIFAALSIAALASARQKIPGWILAITVVVATLFFQFKAPYEDAAVPDLTYRISEGPFKFLYTNPKKGEVIESVQSDLNSLPDSGTILFKDHFPAGALMTELKPLGPNMNILPAFLHPEARPFYFDFFQDRQYFPDYIVEFRYFPMGGENWFYMDEDLDNPQSDLFKWDPFHNFFMKSGEYSVLVDRNVYRILKRKRPGE